MECKKLYDIARSARIEDVEEQVKVERKLWRNVKN